MGADATRRTERDDAQDGRPEVDGARGTAPDAGDGAAVADALRREACEALARVREERPLAFSITNTVTQSLVANAQLAIGGSAAMVYMPDEAQAMCRSSNAAYLNLGTVLPVLERTVPAFLDAVAGVPWALDPVGVGMGELRTGLLARAKKARPQVVRCNASEAIALARLWGLDAGGAQGHVRGVDASDDVSAARKAAVSIARSTGGAVAVSGEVDLVTDGSTVVRCAGGSPLMERITGAGCALGGVAAVLLATAESPMAAALAATSAFDVAGRAAADGAAGPGSFQRRFLDRLHSMTPEKLASAGMEVERA